MNSLSMRNGAHMNGPEAIKEIKEKTSAFAGGCFDMKGAGTS